MGSCLARVQAVTAVLHAAAGLTATALFLGSHPVAALGLSFVVTQAWRSISESFRADFRGSGRTSAYQIMAATGIASESSREAAWCRVRHIAHKR